MTAIAEVKEKITANVKISTVKPPETGGQTCGVTFPKIRLYSEDLDLTIETGYYRTNQKNIELLMKMYNIALNEIVK